MASVNECLAKYKACLGANPDQLRQIQCTFAYIQCILHGLEKSVTTQLKAAGKKRKAKRT